MTTGILILVLIIWLIGALIAYEGWISEWDNSKFEKIWFSFCWFLILPFYIVHYIYNKGKE